MYLVFDTSTPTTTIALGTPSALVGSFSQESKSHGPVLLPAIDALLSEHGVSPRDLTMVGCGIGPGTFTGIRIGMATAKAFTWGLSIPLTGFTGFHVLRRQVELDAPVLTLFDARRAELYYALFEGDEITAGPGLIRPEELGEVIPPELSPHLIGSGVETYRRELGDLYGPEALSTMTGFDPRALMEVAHERFTSEGFTSMDSVEPLYIRPSDAERT